MQAKGMIALTFPFIVALGCGKSEPAAPAVAATEGRGAPATGAGEAPAGRDEAPPTALPEEGATPPSDEPSPPSHDAPGDEAAAPTHDEPGDEPDPSRADDAADRRGLPAVSARARAWCERMLGCECQEPNCEADASTWEPVLPESAWGCLDGLGCDGCDQAKVDACVDPVRDTFMGAWRKLQTDHYCARFVGCGCPNPACAGDLADVPDVFHSYAKCITFLDCGEVCATSGKEPVPGSLAHEQCFKPAIATMNTNHELIMQLHRKVRGERRRVYDQNGNWLYDE